MPLSPRPLVVLRRYWLLDKLKDWFFPGQAPAHPIDADSVRQLFRQACRSAGLEKHCTPYSAA